MNPFFEHYMDVLERLHRELEKSFEGLPQEALDWQPLADTNSMVVLVVHIVGSTRFWVGDVALQESSNRNRDAEFQASGLDAATLKQLLADNRIYVRNALSRLTLEELALPRKSPYHGEQIFSVGWAILHALEHVGLHLGHMQLTRQMWEQRS